MARRVAAISVLGAVVLMVVLSKQVHGALVGLLATAQSLAADHSVAAAGVVVVFAALAAMLAFVSSWVVVPFAVFTWGIVPALVLLWCGWLLGGAASYGVGRFVGRPAVRWLTSPALVERYERRLSQRSTFGLILLLQLGMPSEIPGYLLGVVRYPFVWYLAALGLAELVHGLPAVLLGAGLVAGRVTLVVPVVAALVALTLGAAYSLRRRFAREDLALRESAAPATVDA